MRALPLGQPPEHIQAPWAGLKSIVEVSQSPEECHGQDGGDEDIQRLRTNLAR